MAINKKKKVQNVALSVFELAALGEPGQAVKIVRNYRRTGRMRRADLKQVLGDLTKGVSAGTEGLDELLAGK